MTKKQSRIFFIFLLSTIFYLYKTPHFAFALGEITPISTAITQEETEAVEEEGAIVEEEEETDMNVAANEDIAVQTGTIDPTVPFDGTSLADNLVDLGTQTATTTIGASANTSQTTTQATQTVTETASGTTAQVSGEENVTVGAGETTVTANAGATQTVTTEDLSTQPKESSLIDKFVGIFTGGNEESTTNATGGVQVSSGETQVGTGATTDLGLGGGESTGTVTETTQAVTDTTTQTTNTTNETVSPVTETATETVGGTTAQVSGEENVTVGAGETTVSANAGATQTVTTEDLNQQPKDESLIDKVVNIFTGGNQESTTNATGGVQVSSGETQVGTQATTDLGLGGGESTGTVTETTQTTTDTTNEAAQPPTQTATETETQPTSQNETSETTAAVKSGAPAGDSAPSSKHDEVASKTQSEKTKDQRSVLEQIGSKLFGKASLSGNDQRPALSSAKQGVSGEDCADTGGENGNAVSNCTENKSR